LAPTPNNKAGFLKKRKATFIDSQAKEDSRRLTSHLQGGI
jgi:hypothetical protein